MSELESFNDKLGKAMSFRAKRDFDMALEHLNVPPETSTRAIISESYYWRGVIWMDQRLYSAARMEWGRALRKSERGTYLRYSIENSIAESFHIDGNLQMAERWYGRAVRTCASSKQPPFACISALCGLLALDSPLVKNSADSMVSLAIRKSWTVLDLPSNPDSSDVASCIYKLRLRLEEKHREM